MRTITNHVHYVTKINQAFPIFLVYVENIGRPGYEAITTARPDGRWAGSRYSSVTMNNIKEAGLLLQCLHTNSNDFPSDAFRGMWVKQWITLEWPNSPHREAVISLEYFRVWTFNSFTGACKRESHRLLVVKNTLLVCGFFRHFSALEVNLSLKSILQLVCLMILVIYSQRATSTHFRHPIYHLFSVYMYM